MTASGADVVEDVDLIIVGAGPAGSAAALAALRDRPAARVLLLDRAPIGRDKVCGDAVAPNSVHELDALGVSAVRPEELVPTVRLQSPSGVSQSTVADPPGYVIPRQVLDERLVRAAIAHGARFERVKVTSVTQDAAGVVVEGRWRAPVLIAADGSNSVVRRLVGEPANRGSALAVAIRGYAPTPVGHPFELVLRWDRQRAGGLCYAWAFPTAAGTSNVGYAMSSGAVGGGRARLEERLRALLPEFDLDGVALAGHTLPLSVSRPRPTVGRVLLVGDAASLINPLTGEGIYAALASGALAGAAAVGSSPAAVYSAGLKSRFGPQFRQMRWVYPLMDRRIVLDTAIRAASLDPRAAERLLAFGLGDGVLSLADILRIGRHARPVSSRHDN
jgi:geranylgeranyl reductase family protein